MSVAGSNNYSMLSKYCILDIGDTVFFSNLVIVTFCSLQVTVKSQLQSARHYEKAV